jgi:hypothetical protein
MATSTCQTVVAFIKLYSVLAFLQVWSAVSQAYTRFGNHLSYTKHIVYKRCFNHQITNITLYDPTTHTKTTLYSIFHPKSLWLLLCNKRLSVLEARCHSTTLMACTFYMEGTFYSQILTYESYVAHDMFERLQHYWRPTQQEVIGRHSLYIDTKKVLQSMTDTMRSFSAHHLLMVSLMDVDITEWIQRHQYSFRHSNNLTPQHIFYILQMEGNKELRLKKSRHTIDMVVMDSINLDVATFKDNESIILISPK